MRLKTVILLACLCVLTVAPSAFAQLGPAIGNITTSGSTCSATAPSANCVTLKLDGSTGAATILITGTFVGTGQFEVSNDGLTTWTNINCTPPNSTTAASSATSTGSWQCNVAGWEHIRVRASAFVSGTMSVVINGAHASAKSGGGAVFASGGTTNNVIPKSNGSSLLADSPLLAPDANTVRQANTTTAQVFEIYGTTDSNSTPVNYEKLIIGYNALSAQSTYQFVTTKGGSGTNRGMDFFLGGGSFGIGSTTPSRSFIVASSSGIVTFYNNLTTAGLGLPVILGVTSQKAETTSADANVLTVTPAAVVGTYRVNVNISVSSATSGVIAWTLSWTDSNGNAQSNIAMPLFQLATAAPNTTFTTNVAGNYTGTATIDVNNAAAAIVVKWVGGGTTAAKVSAFVERIQ